MTLKRVLPLFLILGAFLFAACGSDDSGSDTTAGSTAGESEATAPGEAESTAAEEGNAPAPSGEAVRSAKVEIVDFAYGPASVTIQAGGKVTWQNESSSEHTATLDDGSFSTGILAEGKRKSESFKEPGTFSYYCEIHPDMKGTVEVVE